MPQTKAHDYTNSGDINALDEYLNNNPNDIESKDNVCYYMISSLILI